MGHSYEMRQQARREVLRLSELMRQIRHRAEGIAAREAETICKAKIEARGARYGSRCSFGIGKSSVTKELQRIHEPILARELARIMPELNAIEAKIARIIRFFGFNDFFFGGE